MLVGECEDVAAELSTAGRRRSEGWAQRDTVYRAPANIAYVSNASAE
jgi:hypothetical protein